MEEHREDAYKQPYLMLFNDVTDAIRAIERRDYGTALDILVKAQQRAEDRFIEQAE